MLLLAGSASAAVAATHRFEFDVYLDQHPLGIHRFEVTGDPDRSATIESEASFDLRVLGIDIYRYRHHDTERWVGGCMTALDARTAEGGHETAVVGELESGGFRLERPTTERVLPPCVASYAYWDPATLLHQRALLNPQTGALDAVSCVSLGTALVDTSRGRIEASHYRLNAAGHTIDLWYSLSGEWLKLESTVQGGRRLLYQRRDATG